MGRVVVVVVMVVVVVVEVLVAVVVVMVAVGNPPSYGCETSSALKQDFPSLSDLY